MTVDVSKHEHNPTLTDHEVRIRILERDYVEIKEMRGDVKTLQLDVYGIKSSVAALPGQIESVVRNEVGRHELAETKMQARVMWVLLSIAVTMIGSAIYLVAQHFLERAA